MPFVFVEGVLWCGVVLEPDNCFALFYFVINACISHVIITLIRYFLIPKSRDLVSHNPGISELKNGPGSRDPGSRDCNPYMKLDRSDYVGDITPRANFGISTPKGGGSAYA